MGAHRRHHFVPQFYLRRFSGEKGRQIATFVIDRWKYVSHASIRAQAHRDYFYKTDAAEAALAELEGIAAHVLRQVDADDAVPPRGTEHHALLLMFMLMSHARTPANIESASRSMSDMTRESLRGVADIDDLMSAPDLSPPNTLEMVMRTSMESIPQLLDLQCALLINSSSNQLLTSDNPCVWWNPLLEPLKNWACITGVAEKGFAMVLPVSPRRAVLFYDDTSYVLRGEPQRLLLDSSGVDTLNRLQAVNCNNQLYMCLGTRAVSIATLVTSIRQYRSRNRGKVGRAKLLGGPSGCNSEIIHIRRWEPRIRAQIPGMNLRREVRNYELSGTAVEIRNPPLYHAFQGDEHRGGLDVDKVVESLREWQQSKAAGGTDKP